ncbi:ATP-binding protein [Aquabacterium sp. OR-4]|uniref:ATP-binding protein n=1 Tax=Aquabacterium sp. OR-4 TaxID=2978127 RepID=UPI0021B432CC|nr:ATP-binding protein [Aquabacterium sp. OR-4]MDT7835900.1 ATP-binding protein [Aquabacterium sp. OR-4]
MLPFRLAPLPPWWPWRGAAADDEAAAPPAPQRHAPLADDPALSPEARADRSNLMQLVQLRWLAVGGQLLTVLVVHYGLGIRLPILAMLSLLVSLSLFNLASWLRAGTARHVGPAELFLGLLMDLVVLSGLLALSGGVNNPFVFVFLPQLAVGALLLRGGYAWALVLLACVAIMLLAQWHLPLAWPDAPQPQRLSLHYLGGLLLCFALCASLLVLAIGRFARNLRVRDARLAALRQRAAEEDHIVRMGLLASGAAHELGTPLATLSIILGDWSHMAPFAAEPELRDDIEQMQAQVRRCKAIISGILLSAGDSRGDVPMATTLQAFLGELSADWRERRQQPDFAPELGPLPATPIIADTGLRQMVTNVLDNALEAMQAAGSAPPATPRLLVDCHDDRLCLRVLDRGAGFSPEMLASFGRPYHSSKGRPGGGLGLFLSVNVARKLGGNVSARNRETGGAEVSIALPLAALTLEALT